MKIYGGFMKFVFISMILASAWAKGDVVPQNVQWALQKVHSLAEPRNYDARMFKYVYFKDGFCRTCTSQEVQQQLIQLENDMGTDFAHWMATYQMHRAEILHAQSLTLHTDVFSLMMARNSAHTLQRRFFITCVDFIKTIGDLAIQRGMKVDDVRLVWLMDKAGYKKMCPASNGQPPAAPRPFIHTILAFRSHGDWYLLNTENPKAEVYYLGEQLPDRLSRDFSFPSVKGGMVLTVAQISPLPVIFNGFPGQWLPNVTASGILSEDPKDFSCR
jgi:hypothetical protein